MQKGQIMDRQFYPKDGLLSNPSLVPVYYTQYFAKSVMAGDKILFCIVLPTDF